MKFKRNNFDEIHNQYVLITFQKFLFQCHSNFLNYIIFTILYFNGIRNCIIQCDSKIFNFNAIFDHCFQYNTKNKIQ